MENRGSLFGLICSPKLIPTVKTNFREAGSKKTTADGNVYFFNSIENKTQWTHPRTGRKRVVPEKMPFGWRQTADDDGGIIYVNDTHGQSTYVDPRLAFIRDQKEHVNDFRQRFDSSSTAYQVLHGIDLSGKIAVITGCNAGIGLETAKSLARHGCKVIMANRNMRSTEEAIGEITRETSVSSDNLVPMCLDLASMRSVLRFAKELETKIQTINILILNAGVFGMPYATTEDGLELTTQVNHVSHTLLAILLKPMLRRGSRVVFVSSESHRFASFKDGLGNLCLPPEKYTGIMAYNNSKLFNVLTAKMLSHEWYRDGVCVNSLHPGNLVSTNLCNSWWLYRLAFMLARPFTKSLQQAAATSVYVAAAPELDGVTGVYFNNCFHCQESTLARDKETAKSVFSLTLSIIVNAVGADGLQPYLNKYKVI